MNAEEQERFLAALRRDEDFRAAVRRELFTKELLNLPQTVAVLVDAVAQQRQDLTTMAQEITQQRQDFTALTRSVANYMERTLSAVKDVLTGMDAGFTAVQAKFDQVNADLQDIRNQLAS